MSIVERVITFSIYALFLATVAAVVVMALGRILERMGQ